VNVCEPLWPWLRIPVLKLPLLAVALWGCWPLFVQVIVSPTWTVIVGGENRQADEFGVHVPGSTMPTPGSPAAWARAGLLA
jgi:hypothetical protein